MKGIIFNLLEEVVITQHGEDTWDQLLSAAGLEGAYTSLGSYPDEHIQELVGAAARHARSHDIRSITLVWPAGDSLTLPTVSCIFQFSAFHPTVRVERKQHYSPEVRKVYPGADVPTFEFRDELDGGL